jgi:pimeloyl-ACP methyl ester carboxylesterase
MAKCLRKLGVEKCTLVGLSYGGMVGFKMAEMFPDLVDSFVVSCSVMALTESISRASLERIGFPSWVKHLVPDTVEGVKKIVDVSTYKSLWMPHFLYKDVFEVIYLMLLLKIFISCAN